MEDNEVDKWALTYDKYIHLLYQFRSVKNFSSDIVNLDDILAEANFTDTEKKNYYKAFDMLLKHIHQDGVFMNGNNPEACKYINYILYKELQVQHAIKHSYDEKIASLFRKFSEVYGEKYSRKNRCTSNIYSINDQTYNKINALYDVYDKYYKCSFFRDNNVFSGCGTFEDFFFSYDNYMRNTQSKSVEFNEILRNIEQKANAALTKYKIGCEFYNKKPQSPQLFEPPRAQIPEIHNKGQTHETRLHSVDSTSQTHLSKDISTSQPEQDSERRDEGDRAQHVLSASVIHSEDDDHGSNDIHRAILQNETAYPPMREDEGKTQRLLRSQPPFRHLYPPGTSLYSRHDGHIQDQAFSKEVELFPTSFMNTITSTLKNVDPVPVVGVSGGMGVLFLLFRYTPVGTFFRGRGYRQRIPTRFDGVYPGFYPGFEGFEEGHLPNNHINIAYGPE
ncbi:variable surface protein Vir28, putative [Plasmodium vivax]|uniref:Variable surface protein Vir28, putative n=1 Tax=Plasmodium vivax (strain Salvador I) TaxID=126793 RepID=A5KD16_PLAVS|nr:variable surface protein Vir28, putative [Plasmodium vivax]EDL42753.1 variable surface protein Vir28, putative [Plasmodium vivax]|eukprot:XP_001612546.1 variable surface protein Vir28 [Plasmodium vivax Sal-1]